MLIDFKEVLENAKKINNFKKFSDPIQKNIRKIRKNISDIEIMILGIGGNDEKKMECE